jgi:hypothetical protein
MMKTHPHACGVDDNARPFTSTKTCKPAAWMMYQDPSQFSVPFPAVGHFSQALLGQFCVAPKMERHAQRVPMALTCSLLRLMTRSGAMSLFNGPAA